MLFPVGMRVPHTHVHTMLMLYDRALNNDFSTDTKLFEEIFPRDFSTHKTSENVYNIIMYTAVQWGEDG